MSFSLERSALPIAICCLLATAGPAMAHATLVKTVPAANGMAMHMPTELTLTFSEPPELSLTRVTVTGPDGALQTGQLAVGSDPDSVIVPLPGNLADGKYKVDWIAVADDGHKTTGSYSFSAMH